MPAGSRASYSQLIAGGSRVISSARGAPVRRRNSAGLRSCVASPVLVFLRTSLAPGRVLGPSSASRTRLARFVRRSRFQDCYVAHKAVRSQPAPEPKQSGASPIRPGIAFSRHCLVRCAALPARYRPSVSRLIVRPSPPAAGREEQLFTRPSPRLWAHSLAQTRTTAALLACGQRAPCAVLGWRSVHP